MPVTPDGTAVRPGARALGISGLAALLLAAGPLALAPAAAGGVAPVAQDRGRPVRVIVRAADPAAARAAEAAVTGAGGIVGRRLDLISGFAAEVPDAALAALRASPGGDEITADASVSLKAEAWPGAATGAGDTSLAEIAGPTGAKLAPAPLTGAGVGVALIDSGVSPVTGLNQPGKVVHGPDLSLETQSPNLRHLDTYGHGTHLAGIIAGQDPAGATTTAASDRFAGVAPGAHLVSLKVATSDGATDVSQVIAAIDWAVQHRNDTGLNIRVMNLSFGTDSTQDAQLDPLSFAVEAAWRKGIVVVVAVGNDGAEQKRVRMPAANPFVIAVGATDANGTPDKADDTVADFSTRGDSTRHADLLAPGRSVVSLRSPGSFVDVHFPTARPSPDPEQRYLRGSGTSQAAAVVAGAAALLLQQRPALTPDQVKRLLTDTARPVAGADQIAAGAGQVDIARATRTVAPLAVQKHRPATGTGSLELSRGSAHVVDAVSGAELTGERDIFGMAWRPDRWTVSAAAGRSWSGGSWNGRTWTGGGWSGSGTARRWSSAAWSGKTWAGTEWAAVRGTETVWNGRTWSARTWSARTWSARTWSARTWSARTWSARTWSGADWPDTP